MASTSGLTRRRGGGGAASSGTANNGTTNDDNEVSRVSSPGLRSPLPESSFEAAENGHKIAFDPRDLSESHERTKQPKLTLMEEILLMGLKDKQGYLSFWNDNISYALRGCIVMELAFRGRIRMQKFVGQRAPPLRDRLIEVCDNTLTGEVLLDEALKMMKSSEKMCVADWIDLLSGECFQELRVVLICQRGNLESDEDWVSIEASA
jgi:golgi phosphoprotein 3